MINFFRLFLRFSELLFSISARYQSLGGLMFFFIPGMRIRTRNVQHGFPSFPKFDAKKTLAWTGVPTGGVQFQLQTILYIYNITICIAISLVRSQQMVVEMPWLPIKVPLQECGMMGLFKGALPRGLHSGAMSRF